MEEEKKHTRNNNSRAWKERSRGREECSAAAFAKHYDAAFRYIAWTLRPSPSSQAPTIPGYYEK